MNPTNVPYEIIRSNPEHKVLKVGPPPDIADEDCGTVEALVTEYKGNSPFDGATVYRVYYKPDQIDLDCLLQGAHLEISFIGRVVPHSVNVM